MMFLFYFYFIWLIQSHRHCDWKPSRRARSSPWRSRQNSTARPRRFRRLISCGTFSPASTIPVGRVISEKRVPGRVSRQRMSHHGWSLNGRLTAVSRRPWQSSAPVFYAVRLATNLMRKNFQRRKFSVLLSPVSRREVVLVSWTESPTFTDWKSRRLIDCLFVRLIVRSIDWLIESSIDWLIDWLIVRSFDWLIATFSVRNDF